MRSLALVLSLGACVGEASVTIQGTVTTGTETTYRFDHAPNPDGAPAIAGARVELCLEAGVADAATTDATGAYRELEVGFGGFVGVDTVIRVQVTRDELTTVVYETIFEDTDDPLVANPSCDPACPPVYLNLVLAAP